MAEKRKDSHNRVLKDGEIERKDGRCEFRYKDIDGKRKSIYGKTLKELREKEKDIQKTLSNGMVASNKKTLMQGMDEFLEFRNVTSGTQALDVTRKKRLSKYEIMTKPITEIKEIDVKRLIAEMNQEYFRSTIMEDVGVLRSICNTALRNREILFNPFDFQWTPLVNDKKRSVAPLTDEQFERLGLLCQKQGRQWLFLYLTILRETGLRISELCGLTLDCVDLMNKRLTIDKQLPRINGHEELHAPKTNSSKGQIPLTDEAVKALSEAIRRCKNPITISDVEGFFIVNKSGANLLNQSCFRKCLNLLQQDYNRTYPDDQIRLTPHVLRHTAASRLINKGMSPVLVQRLLRHASLNMTLNTYTHITADDVAEEMMKIGVTAP